MINTKMLSKIMGFLLGFTALFMLLTGGVAVLYHEIDTALYPLLKSIGITLIVALIAAYYGKDAKVTFSRRDSFLMITSAWVVVSVLGMLPFLLSGAIPDITNAFFETISGFTTTGATILDDIESLPKSLLFWRSLTQWIGGLGIVFFTIAVLPLFGVGSLHLIAAETSGPVKGKVLPRMGVAAKWIWSIYLTLTIFEVVFLLLGGMNLFESICHAFTTISTGGYSPRQGSIADYHSPYIEYVIAIFMTISGINFSILLLAFSGKIKHFFKDTELRWYIGSVIVFTTLIAYILYARNPINVGFEESFRLAFFQVASLHTSTGYATADYVLWPTVAWALLTLVMLMGACAGSTTGGIKSIRLAIMTRMSLNELKNLIHPHAVLPVRVNNHPISSDIKNRVLSFTFVYLVLVILGSLLMMFEGVGFTESLGCIISAIGNMGPGLGAFGPAVTWNALPDSCKWILSFYMLLGRLELFTVLVLFTPSFWHQN
ncbi:MAG: TrkH family potassium uptake protein [Bacteroidaceae bacterium]